MVKLINLKYLRLTNAHIDGIPSFIAKLQRLQTLDVFGSMGFIELPGEICELKELRHLIGDFDGNLNIETLSNLRTLKYPLSDCSCLVELRLSGKLEKLPEDLHEVLPNLECLSLKKSGLKEDPMPSVREVAEPHDP
ncbi:leucine-rich repeat-containing protein 10B [Citrus clementina]|nr:leucine-rich repeat-containing protein 10B [Citrus x clementina]